MRKSGEESVVESGEEPTGGSKDVAPSVNPEQGGGMEYAISRLQIINGFLDYADQQIKPPFSAHVHDMNGVVGPIASRVGSKTDINLNGMVEAYGKFAGTGSYVPGTDKSKLNLNMNFHNIELTTFTPYSGKFMGYEISKGKLFLDINYRLDGKRIVGKNKVLLDQFTLGNKIPSEKSTNLPVKFALGLMKDRNGKIDFKLPVEGSIDSPAFSWGGLVWTAIKNLVVKIVASPFDYIAGLVGGGPDMQNILFEPGTPRLKEDQEQKIGKVAEALAQRPQLKLEISGQYQDQDIQALKQKKVEAAIEARMKRGQSNRTEVVRSLAKQSLPQDEFNKLPIGEMEARLAGQVPVTDDELKALGLERGKVVMSSFNKLKVPAERVYLLSGAKGDEGKEPQVKLTVKTE